MTQIWKPVVVASVTDVLLEEQDVGLVCKLDDGREEVAWVNPDAVRSSEDLQVVTGWVWDWDTWSVADDLLGQYRHETEEQQEFTVDPSRYFIVGARGGQTFVPARLCTDVERDTVLAVGPDQRLWRYVNGVFVPDGEEFTRSEATRLLAGSYRSEHVQQAVKHFYDRTAHMNLPAFPSREFINVSNGVLLWKTGVGQGHRPEDAAIIQLPVRFDPAATCPGVDRFLTEVLPDEETVEFLYELVGYMMIPANPERKAVLLLGPTGSGKSTFLTLLRTFLGERNCSAASLRDLGDDRFGAADLFGKLANICGDIGRRAPESSEMFKKLTGGDPIRAQHKFHSAFTLHPFCKLIFSANEFPGTGDVTGAYFERWWAVPFPHGLPRERQDPGLIRELVQATELSGLLNAALAGLRRVQERGGFGVPRSVRELLGEYRELEDHVRRFVQERVEVTGSADDVLQQRLLYAAYRAWCVREGIDRPLPPNQFHQRTGLERDGRRSYARIRLVGDAPAG